ncbi:MAG: amino acid permease, partial [Actinobacteria bacterium]|nr:amino acid permease [Actinomycetota bacterium]
MSEGGGPAPLRLRQAVSMAVGGMIGGGIFSVLGVVIEVAGHLAVASFLIGGALALVTAHSYARLTLAHDRAGGSFAFLRQAEHPAAAGWLAWLLVLGYVFTMSVYAFTFGHYLANVIGIDTLFARLFGVAIIAIFVAVNLRGVSTSGLVEDLTVLGKLLSLALVAVIGMTQFATDRLSPLADQGLVGLFVGASVIFMAYEGFQLLAYDYDELDEPHRNLPRALYLSVPAVIAVYVVVTLGSQMLVSDPTIVEQKEVALATVGKEALGTSGL